MSISVGEVGQLHWTYFLVLEEDLLTAARYVEFAESNFDTYSIEFAHLLFAASSEVEVVFKKLCALHAPKESTQGMDDFRRALRCPTHLHLASVTVPRFSLTLRPWDNWTRAVNPDWWKSYNAVKHERHMKFDQATLRAALNAMAGLYLAVLHLACRTVRDGEMQLVSTMDVMAQTIEPRGRLFAFGTYGAEVELVAEQPRKSQKRGGAGPARSG